MTYLEIIQDFLIESYENLDQLDKDLLILEKTPDAKGVIDSIFRTVHTIKGTCIFLGFSNLESFSHTAEGLLRGLRDGEFKFTMEIATLLFRIEAELRKAVQHIEQYKIESDNDFSDIKGSIERYLEKVANESPEVVILPANQLVESKQEDEISLVQANNSQQDGIGTVAEQKAEIKPEAKSESKTPAALDSTVRIDVGLLDRLMNLVGELVLTRNQILQFTNKRDNTALASTGQRLSIITSELQEGVMKTRMQPIVNIWSKFPRVVRDLSLMCGKQVRVEMEGQETELDKTIIEAIKDPLMHIVRNAVDHGIESPEQRISVGKASEGVIHLRAFHEGGQVNIEIKDDGRGILPEKVRSKAIENGLLSREELNKMSDREVLNLIFLPGFSTAEKITNISGRGVGMDVVKTNLEKIGGHVDIQSEVGFGSILKIKIPLTLAIIPALIVEASGDTFAIPQVNLLELVRIEGQNVKKDVKMVHGAPVYKLRGNILPLVSLKQELNEYRNAVSFFKTGKQKDDSISAIYILVLQAESRQFGLIVDGIYDAEEIVVKPLNKQLRKCSIFAGATVMGDGKVALILDIIGLACRSGVLAETKVGGNRLVSDKTVRVGADQVIEDLESLLIVEVGGTLGLSDSHRLAIPLSKVSRLEKFSEEKMERSNSKLVIQYRGEIMTLIDLAECLGHRGVTNKETGGLLDVIVYNDNGRDIGLIVDKIVDIVQERLVVSEKKIGGIIGSTILQGRVSDLPDMQYITATI